jgi:hypothetical protein
MAIGTSSSPELLRPGPRRPHRVVVLCSDGPLERHTCATLVRAGVHVVGSVVCTRRGIRFRAAWLAHWSRRHGLFRTAGQVLGRLYDRARNRRLDERVLGKLVDQAADRATLERARVPMVETDSYSRAAARDAIRQLDPDIFVVHATIGGHPGITPFYRGAYSPFWALLRGERHMVGCTVFLLDDGIDTGPILAQERVAITPGTDSHVTLAWKGMARQAGLQASMIRRLDAGECVPLQPVHEIPTDSYFGPPTLLDLLRYRWQVEVR